MKALLALAYLIFSFLHVSGQIKEVPLDYFDSLFTKERVYYFQGDGKTYYGCGASLEGEPLNLLFTSIKIDKKKNKVHMTGFAYWHILKLEKENTFDTVGIPYLELFLARPSESKLNDKKIIGSFGDNNVNTDSLKWKPNTGFFDIQFTYKCGTNLYFNSVLLFCMREHHMGELFKK